MSHYLIKSTALSFTLLPVSMLAITSEYGEKKDGGTPKEGQPNIVIIVADDLASHELSCYGGQNIVTPHIDRIAREGVQFSHNFASSAISVPIRASLYTGLYPARNGSYQNHKDTYTDVTTITTYMSQAGYRIGRTGKQHPVNPKSIYQFEEIPGFTVNCLAKKAPYNVDGVREFMSRSDDPFCLFVCSIHPHAPWTWGDSSEFDEDKLVMSPEMMDTPEIRKTFTNYLAEVRALDNEVGAIFKVLEETGKLDNTLVIFLGEQGAQYPGAKWNCWDVGIKSALVARYPAKIDAGSESNTIVQYEDILPTLIEFAGGNPIENIDGISFLDALYGKKKNIRKYAYALHNNIPGGPAYPIRAIRDKRYKLILNLTPEVPYRQNSLMNSKSIVWSEWEKAGDLNEYGHFLYNRLVTRPAIEFYDTEVDPFEMNNLAGEKKHRRRIAKMTEGPA